MARIVMKFGGTSTADTAKLQACANHIIREVRSGHQVLAVVSAPAGMTDQLTARIDEIAATGKAGSKAKMAMEADLVLSSGEQINAGLLAMLLQNHGLAARSWTGWQAGMFTDCEHGQARLCHADTGPLTASMAKGEVGVLTGFQGLSDQGRITTLGRGGSDVSAVGIAAAIKADRCDIYTDVDAVYTADPNMVANAGVIDKLGTDVMLEMASCGAKVVHGRAVELALSENIPLQVRSTFGSGEGTLIANGLESHLVSGVTYSRDEACISLLGLASGPKVLEQIFSDLAAAKVKVDMVVQGPGQQNERSNLIFSTSRADHTIAREMLFQTSFSDQYLRMECDTKTAKVSVIGLGLRSQASMTHTFFESLSAARISLRAVATSEIRISALIDENELETAMNSLHFAYELDQRA